jgi:hypothetical protein
MEKKLNNLEWKCAWVSQLGSIKGCLEYLGDKSSMAWLFGITGYAFIINMHETVCPSSPTAWNTTFMTDLVENLGYKDEMIVAFKNQPDFENIQEIAWEKIRKAIDEGLPCYGWELKIPEFYVVNGYNDNEYFYSGVESDMLTNNKPWNELGKSDIGVLELHIVKPNSAITDINKIIRDSLEFAIKHSKNPPELVFPKYKSGIEGFDNWINAIKENKANKFGFAYNTAVWNECRQYGVQFLEEVKTKMDLKYNQLFENAKINYQEVSNNLNDLSKLFPFPHKDELENENNKKEAIRLLESARETEIKGLKSLEDILKSI